MKTETLINLMQNDVVVYYPNGGAACKLTDDDKKKIADALQKNDCDNCGFKVHSEAISKLVSCNNCGKTHDCSIRPEYGQYCRINCAEWEER